MINETVFPANGQWGTFYITLGMEYFGGSDIRQTSHQRANDPANAYRSFGRSSPIQRTSLTSF